MVNEVKLPLDHIAFIGYSFLFVFSLYKLSDTLARPVDLLANILLLVGLGALITYHMRNIVYKKDETQDAMQKHLRLLAHTTITSFFVVTLVPMSKAAFQFYDSFGLAAHAYLTYAVAMGVSQLLGVALLFLYFLFASIQKLRMDNIGAEILTLFGRLLMLVFFGVSTLNGVMKLQ